MVPSDMFHMKILLDVPNTFGIVGVRELDIVCEFDNMLEELLGFDVHGYFGH